MNDRPIAPPSRSMHLYEVRPRKDHRGVDLICDALAFAFYDEAGNTIETHEHTGEFKDW